MDNKTIVHISEVSISPNSGMGRVEYYWQKSFEDKGYKFIHIGPADIGPIRHPGLFPYKAYRYYKSLKIIPAAIIVHEPAAGCFVGKGIPCFLESHGVERRYWAAQLNGEVPPSMGSSISLKTKLLFPLWRLRNCDKGVKYSEKLLLINSDDKEYVKTYYKRKDKDIFLFKNGVAQMPILEKSSADSKFTVLYNASWLERKGNHLLVKAAQRLHQQKLNINYLLIGTGKTTDEVLSDWPEELRKFVTVIKKFDAKEEAGFLASSSLFVLPSYFEGQPLSLLQAMAAGMCCITTDCCGQKDIVINKKTGFLFDVGSYEQLASAITHFYNDKLEIARIGKNAKESVLSRNWKNVSDELVEYVIKNI